VSSIPLQRNSSGSGDSLRGKRQDSDESDGSEQVFNLTALKRARLQNVGGMSMFGVISGYAQGPDDDALANAERLRGLFDLPADENISTGSHGSKRGVNGRVSRLADEECHDTRIHASYRTSHLFLRSAPKDRCTSTPGLAH
jgi:hypothetical protein